MSPAPPTRARRSRVEVPARAGSGGAWSLAGVHASPISHDARGNMSMAEVTRPDSLTVGVVGTGLIGSSFGMSVKRVGARVRGADIDPFNLVRSLELGAIDADTDLDGLSACDAVVVAVPTASTRAVTEALLERVEPTTAVIDTASVKEPIVSQIKSAKLRRLAPDARVPPQWSGRGPSRPLRRRALDGVPDPVLEPSGY